MNRTFRTMFFAAAVGTALPAAAADDVTTYTTDTVFADVAFEVNGAIINRGYVVDYHGLIGEMLQRTAEDVGADKALYRNAEFFQFCSAVVSREAMEADIGNIAYCPYVVFVYETEGDPGTVHVGFRRLPAGGGRDKVNEMLDEIAREAAGQ
ncbi:DUF302 domain-containing protein [Nitratireductor mangrovi]|uniref:DUF302 domain-containing protein n=1 Tax=Nitratireductor mangrovi TaxID=2599600 RepID=A0A5B8L536_9HYPH|nr:DUF302 domain-containing protein [Nitratireductor mangrovi]QDZ02638.1 DUF302 domain-containing protein [Nitratireductor mangrovi]